MVRVLLAAAAMAAGSFGVAHAGSCCEPPTNEWLESYDFAASGAMPPIEAQVGNLTVVFEVTTLSDVMTELGGTIQHAGDASESIYWLCYTLPASRFWIVSHGEMGGENYGVTEIAVDADPSGVAFETCPMADIGPGEDAAITVAGVGLGSDLAALESAFGPPGTENEIGTGYYMETPSEVYPDCVVSSVATAVLDSDEVRVLSVSRFTAC